MLYEAVYDFEEKPGDRLVYRLFSLELYNYAAHERLWKASMALPTYTPTE